jgi:glycosyltransferase involved in cell wall biosynthesis
MRVLWFSVTPSLYSKNSLSHNGGGWISSLESLVCKKTEVQLGIAFEHADSCFKVEQNKVTYYPINVRQSKWEKLKRKLIYEPEEIRLIPACLRVIDDFKPDVIHVFGSEWCFGLITLYTEIPVIIHMQGSMPPIYNAQFPSGYSKIDLIKYSGFNIKKIFRQKLNEKTLKSTVIREEKILRSCHYYMGRTEWDCNLTKLYNLNSKYFYCSESLREPFISTEIKWKHKNCNKAIFMSTISPLLSKGFDVILKTAKLIKENTDIDFEWRVFGTNEIQFHEWKTKIKASNVNVKLMGTVSAEILKDELINANIFIHLSYIDNSPNSVCEAQTLGLPIISTNVGGISSIVEHKKTGLLVPANDPFSTASYIKLLFEDIELAVSLGRNAREVALKRHNPQQITSDLLGIYDKVILDEKKN